MNLDLNRNLNRLAHETSPYLRQHMHNPVDWYPWGDEALSRARRENKPILLSIGYSACHWCHVMAHESFENPEVARLMNESYINIKVDREERPDLDHIYQNVAQALTLGGGWPLTVFLTPDLRPFFGGTYFPPDDKYGRPGFPRVLVALAEAYRTDPQGILDNAQKLTDAISSLESVESGAHHLPRASDLKNMADKLLKGVDLEMGGMAGAPKFPNEMVFSFLWRYGLFRHLNDDSNLANLAKSALHATRLTLTRMAQGGIYDQLGGGFHRYSVDATWSVPHFEKMLYDNGLLLKLYAEVLLTSRMIEEGAAGECPGLTLSEKVLYLAVLRETTEYVLREMRSPEGGFYSAQDADTEGEEGKYFVWDLEDLAKILTSDEARAFALRYGVSDPGNFEGGKTVLWQSESLERVSQAMGIAESQVESLILSARSKLLEARSKRVAPGVDHKILVSWNALMISGLAWASEALKEAGDVSFSQRVMEAARGAYDFIKKNMSQGQDRLFSTYVGTGPTELNTLGTPAAPSTSSGTAKWNAYLDDYAFLAQAALDLARFSPVQERCKAYLEDCQIWIEVILKHFKDPSSPGYFFTSDDHEALIQRPKTLYDQAIPSGTAVALTCLAALAELDVRGNGARYQKELEEQLGGISQSLNQSPYGMGELCCLSLLFEMGPITLSGPNVSSLCAHPHVFQKPEMGSASEGILICHRRTCGFPAKTPDEVSRRLKALLTFEK